MLNKSEILAKRTKSIQNCSFSVDYLFHVIFLWAAGCWEGSIVLPLLWSFKNKLAKAALGQLKAYLLVGILWREDTPSPCSL